MKTYNLRCEGEIHRIGLDDDGLHALDHEDEEEERIAAELGDKPTPCIGLIKQIEDELSGIDTYHLDWGGDKHDPLSEMIDRMVESDNFDIVKLLLDVGVSDKARANAFWVAANHGRLDMLKYLYDRGIPETAYRASVLNEALGNAAEEAHTEVIEYLIKKGANPNDGGSDRIPLEWAVRTIDVGAVRALLEGGADPNRSYMIPYGLIVADDYLDDEHDYEPGAIYTIFAYLLEHGLDMDRMLDAAKPKRHQRIMEKWWDENRRLFYR